MSRKRKGSRTFFIRFPLSPRAGGGRLTVPNSARSSFLTLLGGLDAALYDKSRPGAAPILEARQKQRVIALVCSDPPAGRARWTVRLIAQEAVKRGLVPRVGRETIRILLLDHDLKP